MADTKKPNIWMPLYVADYQADTAYLTTEQHGAYLLMLMAYWRNGPIPDNDQIIAAITRQTPDAWSITRAVLEPMFQVSDGYWLHKRVESEYEKAKRNRSVAHEKAAKAAKTRWDRERERMLQALHEHMPEQCPSPSPSPTHSKSQAKSLEHGASAPSKKGTRIPEDWTLTDDLTADATAAGVPVGAVPTEAAKFRDYWTAKAGKDGVKLDWRATWRNWCRNAAERTYRSAKSGRHDISRMVYEGNPDDRI